MVDFLVISDLMRAHVAFYIVSLVLLVAAIACGALGCWKYSTYSCRAAAMCCIAAGTERERERERERHTHTHTHIQTDKDKERQK